MVGRRRRAVERVTDVLRVSQRQVCRVAGQHRSTQRRTAPPNPYRDKLVARMRELAMATPRRGRRSILDVLRRERWSIGVRLMKRLWRQEGLLVPQKRVKRRRIGTGENGIVESFNGRLRDELQSSEIFDTLAEARYLIDRWRLFYNHRRIQRALGKVTPAAFAATCLARPPLRLAALACAAAAPGTQGAATMPQLA
jgi:transposase InsO family protein